VATPAQKPSTQYGTPNAAPADGEATTEAPTSGVTFPQSGFSYTVTPPTVLRPRASVEIETLAKGPPKVTVRVDDDDIANACRSAIYHYISTVYALEKDIMAEAKKRVGDPDLDPKITG
jgi:hypothetical protein